MDADGVLALILLLLHWRVTLCLIVSSILALLLVHIFSWLNGFQGVFLAMLGMVPGVLWDEQQSIRKEQPKTAVQTTSAGVAGASSLLAGAGWGALSAQSPHTFFAGFAIFMIAAWAWYRFAQVFYAVPRERIYLCVALAAIAYPIAAALVHIAP
jgi:zinc transporter ZupT